MVHSCCWKLFSWPCSWKSRCHPVIGSVEHSWPECGLYLLWNTAASSISWSRFSSAITVTNVFCWETELAVFIMERYSVVSSSMTEILNASKSYFHYFCAHYSLACSPGLIVLWGSYSSFLYTSVIMCVSLWKQKFLKVQEKTGSQKAWLLLQDEDGQGSGNVAKLCHQK